MRAIRKINLSLDLFLNMSGINAANKNNALKWKLMPNIIKMIALIIFWSSIAFKAKNSIPTAHDCLVNPKATGNNKTGKAKIKESHGYGCLLQNENNPVKKTIADNEFTK